MNYDDNITEFVGLVVPKGSVNDRSHLLLIIISSDSSVGNQW